MTMKVIKTVFTHLLCGIKIWLITILFYTLFMQTNITLLILKEQRIIDLT